MTITIRNAKVRDTRYRDSESIELRLIESCNFVDLIFKNLEELQKFTEEVIQATTDSIEKSHKV